MNMIDRYPDIIEAAFDDGKNHFGIHKMAQRLAETSPIFEDMPWIEANGRYVHQATIRTGLWSAARVSFTIGRSRPAEFVSNLFYGDPVENPHDICGFAAHYNSLNPGKAQNAVNVIDGGCDGGSSVWLVQWHRAHLMVGYPVGSEAGLSEDQIHAGLCISDWRLAVRVANIGLANADQISDLMAQAEYRIPRYLPEGRRAFYMPKRVHEWIGKPDKFRDDIKIRVLPQLRDNEPRVI